MTFSSLCLLKPVGSRRSLSKERLNPVRAFVGLDVGEVDDVVEVSPVNVSVDAVVISKVVLAFCAEVCSVSVVPNVVGVVVDLPFEIVFLMDSRVLDRCRMIGDVVEVLGVVVGPWVVVFCLLVVVVGEVVKVVAQIDVGARVDVQVGVVRTVASDVRVLVEG